MEKQHYFLGLGSNIEPEKYIPKIIAALFEWSARVDVSKVYWTAPENLDSQRHFLNAAVRIESELEQAELKQKLVAIEEDLGRDRSDPDKKIKDRTADIDILFGLSIQIQQLKNSQLPKEEYIRRPLIELLHYLNYEIGKTKKYPEKSGVELKIKDWSVGTKEVSLQRHATEAVDAF